MSQQVLRLQKSDADIFFIKNTLLNLARAAQANENEDKDIDVLTFIQFLAGDHIRIRHLRGHPKLVNALSENYDIFRNEVEINDVRSFETLVKNRNILLNINLINDDERTDIDLRISNAERTIKRLTGIIDRTIKSDVELDGFYLRRVKGEAKIFFPEQLNGVGQTLDDCFSIRVVSACKRLNSKTTISATSSSTFASPIPTTNVEPNLRKTVNARVQKSKKKIIRKTRKNVLPSDMTEPSQSSVQEMTEEVSLDKIKEMINSDDASLHRLGKTLMTRRKGKGRAL